MASGSVVAHRSSDERCLQRSALHRFVTPEADSRLTTALARLRPFVIAVTLVARLGAGGGAPADGPRRTSHREEPRPRGASHATAHSRQPTALARAATSAAIRRARSKASSVKHTTGSGLSITMRQPAERSRSRIRSPLVARCSIEVRVRVVTELREESEGPRTAEAPRPRTGGMAIRVCGCGGVVTARYRRVTARPTATSPPARTSRNQRSVLQRAMAAAVRTRYEGANPVLARTQNTMLAPTPTRSLGPCCTPALKATAAKASAMRAPKPKMALSRPHAGGGAMRGARRSSRVHTTAAIRNAASAATMAPPSGASRPTVSPITRASGSSRQLLPDCSTKRAPQAGSSRRYGPRGPRHPSASVAEPKRAATSTTQ